MQHIVAGTAGHIDHGKTTLVRALTGMETDRLEEEKRRGISIDLGFANLALTSQIHVAFIDVPGHEKFIKNMLAGIGGIDVVLLIIAADESVKPQTREHFDICRLLGISRGIVVLTKADLVEPDILDLVRLEVADLVAGSFLEDAPVIAVSAVTGLGLPELKHTLLGIADTVVIRDDSAYFRLPIDRSFTMPGFGPVVTGSIWSGSVATQQEIQLYPSLRLARVRGIQVYGKPVPQASAGQRAALNLAGVDHVEVRRGQFAAEPGVFRPTSRLHCLLEMLPSAPALKPRTPVHFHSGTSEIEAEIRSLDRREIAPGSSVEVVITLREASVLLPGDRFIVRRFSPVTTIGGGSVVDPFPPSRKIRATGVRSLSEFLSEYSIGCSTEELSMRTGLRADRITASLADSAWIIGNWIIDRSHAARLGKDWHERLSEFHRLNPLQDGLSQEELRTRTLPDAPPAVFEHLLAQQDTIVRTGELLRLSSHKTSLKVEEESALQQIEAVFRDAGLQAPALPDVLRQSKLDPKRARSLLQILVKSNRLVRVTDEFVLHASASNFLRELLAARKGQRFSVSEFKEWTGVSRKYAIPLLEWLDRERVTRREGDLRFVP